MLDVDSIVGVNVSSSMAGACVQAFVRLDCRKLDGEKLKKYFHEPKLIVVGSSATSSVTSRSGRSGTEPPPPHPHPHPQALLNHSTGIPVGLLRISTSPDGSHSIASGRSRSRSSSFCASLARTGGFGELETSGTPVDPIVVQYLPNLEHSTNWELQSGSARHNTNSQASAGNQTAQISSTAASLLTQLSGQLQQLSSSNATAPLKRPPSTDSHTQKELGEFNLPAPPSPDMLDVR
ncbi:unnamed protein product [Hydatigera taeniaeformis]|uniref:Guanylate cyclase domain-containing protein n=1 Tax=Hydatigena taeniaeformis TaxID=6205 RepID=A0A158RDY0_HYDTA|nr:unnamed protein product [Hydatigera taeniaeformis]